mgnify:FL=1
MKNNLLFLLITIALTSCSTYNHNSNNKSTAYYELKIRKNETLFDQSKVFVIKTNELKFYIHDIDDSTFQIMNTQINDTILSGKLQPLESNYVLKKLNRDNVYRKNDVHIDINQKYTNDKSEININPNEVIKVQSYTWIKQVSNIESRNIGGVLLFALGIVLGILLIFAVKYIWKQINPF